MNCFHLLLACVVSLAVGGIARGENVEGQYIITFYSTNRDEVENCVQTLENEYNITVKNTYYFDSFTMLSVCGHLDALVEAQNLLSQIAVIEENADVDASGAPCEDVSSPGTWGLDRIEQREPLRIKNELHPGIKLTLGPYSGAGVTAYVVDTGIDISHPDFNGRASWGYTAIDMDGDVDNNGHGTHVAGIVGSTSYGVARNVTLVAVKVLKANALGTYESILDGLSWVFNDHMMRTAAGDYAASVVVLPWSAPRHCGVNNAIKALVRQKAIVIAAAGNNNGEACLRTPASAPGAITVGSMNIWERVSLFSNWGRCVHIYAPGLKVLSTWPGDSTKVFSGTSMAAAHVAGVASVKLSKEARTSGEMKAWMVHRSTKGILIFKDDNHATSPNRLLFYECLLSDN